MRKPILPTDNMDEVMSKMTEGSIEAERCLSNLFRETRGIEYLLKLDHQNIRGEQIVAAFRKYKSVKELCRALDEHDHTLIEYINMECLDKWQDYHTRAKYL